MPTSRRAFLRNSALVASLPLLAGRSAFAQTTTPSTGAASPAPGTTKGLLFDRSDLPRIRANLELPRFAPLKASLTEVDLDDDEHFLRHELRLNNRVQDQARARKILERSAFVFTLYGEAAHLAIARLALRRLMDYETWDYFIEGGTDIIGFQRAPEATIATCLALDWLGEHLSAEEIAEAEDNLATKGAPACYLSLYGLKYPDRVKGWGFDRERDDIQLEVDFTRWPLILNATNLKVIPTCALGMAAAWLHGRHPEANKWLEMSRQSAKAFSVMYGLDGSYDEGVGYWGYTTLHLALQSEVLYRRLGIDDRDLINYPGTAHYAAIMSMPTRGAPVSNPNEPKAYNATPKGTIDPARDTINFGDSGVHGADASVAPWIGRVTGDPVANEIANSIGVINHYHGAVWYDPDAPTAPLPDALLDVRMSNDWVVSRTAWDVDSTVVALRSGGPANHEHADRNSIIFKAYGERLFHDPFKASYSPTHPQWLLRLTPAHSAVLINGEGHQYHDGSEGTNASWASAKVVDYATGEGWMRVVSDATDAYQLVNDSVRRVERSLLFLKPGILLVLDRVSLAEDRPQPVQVRYQVYNEDGRGESAAFSTGFTIDRPHALLAATVRSLGATIIRARRLDLPETSGIYPFVEIESTPAAEHAVLTVAGVRSTDGAPPLIDAKFDVVARTWHVRTTQAGRTTAVTVSPHGDLPTFTLA